ncbi:MAG: isoprenylcysteine carboxylmethyltransferase family protein, partial [Candidatus Omnitrophota bacterium]
MPWILARVKRLLRLRFAVLYPLGVYLILCAVPDNASLRAGAGFLLAGLFIRLWSNGYAIKLDRLTTSGPYAWVRNPLYLGTALILWGVFVMLKLIVPGAVFFGVMAAVYARTIRNEEKMLAEKFGAAYLAYRAHVPAMWPALAPYAPGEKWSFSVDRLWFSREHKVVLWVTIGVIGFYLKKEFLTGGGLFMAKNTGIMILAGMLVSLDLY